jgi:FtsZ-binding cell division protein ZapB
MMMKDYEKTVNEMNKQLYTAYGKIVELQERIDELKQTNTKLCQEVRDYQKREESNV